MTALLDQLRSIRSPTIFVSISIQLSPALRPLLGKFDGPVDRLEVPGDTPLYAIKDDDGRDQAVKPKIHPDRPCLGPEGSESEETDC